MDLISEMKRMLVSLAEAKNAATLRMEFAQNVGKCENGPLITQ